MVTLTHYYFLVFLLSYVTSEIVPSSDNPTPKALEHIGTVDGKAYFFDSTVSLTWTEARNYCTSSGLRLATITTRTQYDYLKARNSEPGFGLGKFWIGGRESRTHSMIVYDGSNDQPLTQWELDTYYLRDAPYNCVLYYASQGLNWWVHFSNCNARYSVLCETAG